MASRADIIRELQAQNDRILRKGAARKAEAGKSLLEPYKPADVRKPEAWEQQYGFSPEVDQSLRNLDSTERQAEAFGVEKDDGGGFLSVIGDVLDVAAAPVRAGVYGGLNEVLSLTGGPLIDADGDGSTDDEGLFNLETLSRANPFSDDETQTFAEILSNQDVGNYWGDMALTGLGFVADVATDPLTYVSGGAGRIGKVASQSIGKKTTEKLLAKKVGSDVDEALKQAWLRTDEGAVWKKRLDAAETPEEALELGKAIDDEFAREVSEEEFKRTGRVSARVRGANRLGLETQATHYADGIGEMRRQLNRKLGGDKFTNELIEDLTEDELGGIGVRVPWVLRKMGVADGKKIVRSGLWKKGGIGDGTGRAYDAVPGLGEAFTKIHRAKRAAGAQFRRIPGWGSIGGDGSAAFNDFAKNLKLNGDSPDLTKLMVYNVARDSRESVFKAGDVADVAHYDAQLKVQLDGLSDKEKIIFADIFESAGNKRFDTVDELSLESFEDIGATADEFARAKRAAEYFREEYARTAKAAEDMGITIRGQTPDGSFANRITTDEYDKYLSDRIVTKAKTGRPGSNVSDITTGIGDEASLNVAKTARQLNKEFREKSGLDFDMFETDPLQSIRKLRNSVRQAASTRELIRVLDSQGMLVNVGVNDFYKFGKEQLEEITEGFDSGVRGLATAVEDAWGEADRLMSAASRRQSSINAVSEAGEESVERVLNEVNDLLQRKGARSYGDLVDDVGKRLLAGASDGRLSEEELLAVKSVLEVASDRNSVKFYKLPDLQEEVDALRSLTDASKRALDVLNDDGNLTTLLASASAEPSGDEWARILSAASGLTDKALDELSQSMPIPDVTDLSVMRALEERLFKDVLSSKASVDALASIKPAKGQSASSQYGAGQLGTKEWGRFNPNNDSDLYKLSKLQEYQARGEFVEAISNMFRTTSTEGQAAWKESYDGYIQFFKKWATIGRGPGFFARNFSGAHWNSFIAGVSKSDQEAGFLISKAMYQAQQKATKKAKEIAAAPGDVVDEELLDIYPNEIRRALEGKFVDGVEGMDLYDIYRAGEAQRIGVGSRTNVAIGLTDDGDMLNREAKRIINGDPDSATNRLLNRTTRRVGAALDRRWINPMSDVSQGIENQVRYATMVTGLRRHGTDDTAQWAAANLVKSTQFDYTDLNEFERRLAKSGKGNFAIMPFFVWSRNNIPLQARAIMNEPGKVAAMLEAQEAAKLMLQDEDNNVLEEYLPEWLKDRNSFLGGSPFGAPIAIGLNSPLTDINILPTELSVDAFTDAGRTFVQDDLTGGFNPVVKGAIETVTGRDSFTGTSFERPGQEVSPFWSLFDMIPGVDTVTYADGKTYTDDTQMIKAIKNFLPPLGQSERLLPFGPLESDKYQERLATSWWSQTVGGLLPVTPTATFTDDQKLGSLSGYRRDLIGKIEAEAAQLGVDMSKVNKYLRDNPSIDPKSVDVSHPMFQMDT